MTTKQLGYLSTEGDASSTLDTAGVHDYAGDAMCGVDIADVQNCTSALYSTQPRRAIFAPGVSCGTTHFADAFACISEGRSCLLRREPSNGRMRDAGRLEKHPESVKNIAIILLCELRDSDSCCRKKRLDQ